MYVGPKGKRPLSDKLWLVPLVVVGSLFALIVLYQVGKWWRDSRPSTPAVIAASDPYDEWETVMMLKNETNEHHFKTKLVSRTVNRTTSQMDFEYLCRKGKGRTRIESTNGKDWSGTWEIPGGWGNLTLTLNPQGDSLRGRWWDPESPKPDERDGGKFQIMRIR